MSAYRYTFRVLLVWGTVCTPGYGESDAGLAAGDPSPQQLISSLAFPLDTEVAFEQSQLNPLFKRVTHQQGVMLKSTEQGLIMRVTAPRAEERRIHNGAISLTRQVRNRLTSGYRPVTQRAQLDPHKPSHLVLKALEALLNGQYEVLQQYFKLTAQTIGDQWRIRLQPIDPAIQTQLSRLWFTGSGEQLLNFRSERDDGTGSFSHFLEVRIGPAGQPNTASETPLEAS